MWRQAGRERSVSDEELTRLAPAHVLRKVLPSELATDLLKELLHDSKEMWQSTSWVIHGKEHMTPRTTAMYDLTLSPVGEADEKITRESGEQLRKSLTPSKLLREAAGYIHAAVKQQRPESTWSPTLALGNRYDDGRSCVGWHSDFLNSLGPRPIIVGLSLGACRRFSLRRTSDNSVRSTDQTYRYGRYSDVSMSMSLKLRFLQFQCHTIQLDTHAEL